MIARETIERIIDSARIEEVVGDFVNLKRRGANLLGLCPFHNEKTPSFSVSPARGIYKCFGCGKAGNPVGFIMEHEHFTYPEALRYLAKKYNIEIEEEQKEYSPQEIAEQQEKESLFVISSHAQKFFTEQLWNTEEGRNVGLSYFRERGFSDETIKNFQLGYSPATRSAYASMALKEGFRPEHLVLSGLGIEHNNDYFDRFSGRVMFPIHSLSGRVLAFGGRTLQNDKKVAKYLNSPESVIYHKSKILYGIFQARKAISAQDTCYLVEGYTDVISLHQQGIENVVASSGTSLTTDQIRLIKRYTTNITILYDGDSAGVKASLRGINMILEEGLNVRVVLFPDGEDPDSFARKNGREVTQAYLNKEAKDFIAFKASLLHTEAGGDPLKKAALIRDIVSTIALIPDTIARSLYVRECAALFSMDESAIIFELNRVRKDYLTRRRESNAEIPAPPAPDEDPPAETEPETTPVSALIHQESDLIRLMLLYGDRKIPDTHPDNHNEEIFIAHLVIEELKVDDLHFTKPVFERIHEIYRQYYEQGTVPDLQHFLHHEDKELAAAAIDITSSMYSISPGWEKHNIMVHDEDADLQRAINGAIYTLKNRHVEQIKARLSESLRHATEEEMTGILKEIKKLDEIKSALNDSMGRVIIK